MAAQLTELKPQIEEIVKDLPVKFGVAIKNLESGEEVFLNNDRPYQLASVFKIPVLVTAMQQIDARRFTLDDRITLKYSDKTSPSGILTYLRDGLQPTVEDLLMLMIIISDNTATDMVIDLVGGLQVVNATMRKLGFTEAELNITKSVHGLFNDVFGFSEPVLKRRESILKMKEKGVNFDGEVFRPGSTANVATPQALNRLNEMIFRGQAASPKSCAKALDILFHQTLNARLPGMLPPDDPDVDVAHKTGTFFGVRNDSGIFYVGERVHVAVTVFTQREGPLNLEMMMEAETSGVEGKIDTAIAQIGKLVYEYGKSISL
jgi:beta-lactamase class A